MRTQAVPVRRALSNLDVRVATRIEIAKLHRDLGATMINDA
ncbi:MAG: hypothetical protein R3D63_15280 [Paracoccaceae bacterium]